MNERKSTLTHSDENKRKTEENYQNKRKTFWAACQKRAKVHVAWNSHCVRVECVFGSVAVVHLMLYTLINVRAQQNHT